MEPSKFQLRMDTMQGAASTAWQVAEQETLSIIADATRAFERAAKRATVPDGLERVEFKQHKGPTIEFTGRLLAETEFETRGADPMHVTFEIWETAGGALVAVVMTRPFNRGFEIVRATVAERQDDAQAMHFAVMDHFDWGDAARNMARKLGWSLRMEVE